MDTEDYIYEVIDRIRGKINLILEEEEHLHPTTKININSIITELEMNLVDNVNLLNEDEDHYYLEFVTL